MSNAIVSPAPVVYQTKAFSKSFEAFPPEKLETIARGLVPFNDAESVKPSCIKMNLHTFKASAGAKASPVSLLTSLLWAVAAYAHGQQKIEALQDGLPPLSQFALVAACGVVKCGAGIDAFTLRNAALMGLEKTLALGFKPKADKTAPAIAPTTAPAVAPTTAPAVAGNESTSLLSLDALRRNEASHDAAWAAYGDALGAAFKENSRPGFVSSFAAWASSHEDQALDALREMAEKLGYTLRKAPTKKAA